MWSSNHRGIPDTSPGKSVILKLFHMNTKALHFFFTVLTLQRWCRPMVGSCGALSRQSYKASKSTNNHCVLHGIYSQKKSASFI